MYTIKSIIECVVQMVVWRVQILSCIGATYEQFSRIVHVYLAEWIILYGQVCRVDLL